MNKTELIAAVAEASGKSKADVKDVLDALTAQIVKTVKAGDEISLVGFGTFKSAKREAPYRPQSCHRSNDPDSQLLFSRIRCRQTV